MPFGWFSRISKCCLTARRTKGQCLLRITGISWIRLTRDSVCVPVMMSMRRTRRPYSTYTFLDPVALASHVASAVMVLTGRAGSRACLGLRTQWKYHRNHKYLKDRTQNFRGSLFCHQSHAFYLPLSKLLI